MIRAWRADMTPFAEAYAVLDVGGGAGRIGLPLALHCRELTTVDSSPAMHASFEAAAREAEITNVRYVEAAWPNDDALVADVGLTTHVTYFVRDIVPFLQALQDRGFDGRVGSLRYLLRGAITCHLSGSSYTTWTTGRRSLLGSASRNTSCVRGAMSPCPNSM